MGSGQSEHILKIELTTCVDGLERGYMRKREIKDNSRFCYEQLKDAVAIN